MTTEPNLAPTLNGGKNPSKQGAAWSSRLTDASSIRSIGSSNISTKDPATLANTRAGPSSNPFANGLRGLRSDGPSALANPSVYSKDFVNAKTASSSITPDNASDNTKKSSSSAVVRDVQELERRGFMRSNSTPSARVSSSVSQIRGKRRLPGPAGNLPKLSAEEKEQLFRSRGVPFGKDTRISTVGSTSPNSSIKKKMKAVHHGPVDSMFATGAWEEMLKTYGLPDYRPSTLSLFKGLAPMIKLTISDIESRQDLHRGKVSNLVVMIKEVAMSEIDAAVTLLDPSGEMRGTVHRTVLERYKNNEIRVGTVLALENVSVFSPTPVSHYLIITIRNILRIFQPLPPTIVLSPGSSQDRLSQKKRKFAINSQDSQDSGKGSQNQTPEIASVGSSSTKPIKHHGQLETDFLPASDDLPPMFISASPDWEEAKPTTTTTTSSASTEMQNMRFLNGLSQDSQQRGVKSAPASQYNIHASPMSPQMSNKKPKQESSNRGSQSKTSTGSTMQETPYTREVQFQSLRQTLGGPSMVSVEDAQTQLATPVIVIGSLTPVRSVAPSIGGSSGLLSSFAAPSNLRKRSSPTMLGQKSGSSESASDSQVARTPPNTVSHALRPTVVAPSSTPIELSSSPASIEIRRSYSLQRLDSSDWPDDFEGIDFGEALEEDLSTTSISDLQTINQPKQSSVTYATRRSPSSKSTPPFASWQTADDDDEDEKALDNLLDGLDEAELFDL